MSDNEKNPAELAELKAFIKEAIAESNEKLRKEGDPNEAFFRNIADSHEVAKKQGYEPGVRLARMARAVAAAALNKQGAERALEIISKVYGDPLTAKAVEKAMESGTPSAGGLMVPEQFSNEMIPLLRAQSTFMAAMPRIIPNPTGTLHMGRHTAGSTSYWGREGKKVKTSKPSVGRLTLREKTLRGMTALSNRLLLLSNAAVDRFALDDLVAGQAVQIDAAFYNGAGNEDEPLGVLKVNGTNTVTLNNALTATNTSQFIKTHATNLGTLVRPHWFANYDVWFQLVNLQFDTNGPFVFRTEVNDGKFWGMPISFSTQIPTEATANNPTSMILADMNEMLVGQVRTAEIAVSTEAGYYDESDTFQSAYANDETLVRLIQSLDFGPRQLKSFTISKTIRTT